MDDIIGIASRYNARILIGGDLFDRPRDWPLLGRILPLLRSYIADVGSRIPLTVRGQHDVYMRNMESNYATTMGVLESSGYLEIIQHPSIGLRGLSDMVTVVGCSWGDPIPQPVQCNKGRHILVIHAPIAEEKAYPGHSYIDALHFVQEHDYDLILCGDVHRRFEIVTTTKGKRKTIINTGPILRLKADEYNMRLKPAVAIFDTDTKITKWVYLKTEKNVFVTEHLERNKEQELMLSEFIEAIQKPDIGIGVSMIERVQQWAKYNKDYEELIALLTNVCGI